MNWANKRKPRAKKGKGKERNERSTVAGSIDKIQKATMEKKKICRMS